MKSIIKYITLSNTITYLALLSSLAAMNYAINGNAKLFAVLLGVSVICDLTDGRFASFFRRDENEKKFGGELDSLVDAISFGFVPASGLLIMFGFTPFNLLAALIYLIATVSRLAFYNVFTQEKKTHFIGVPTTVIGLFWAISGRWINGPTISGTVMLIFALLMVLPVKIKRPNTYVLLTIIATSIASILYNLCC